jgi:hypothetical protein
VGGVAIPDAPLVPSLRTLTYVDPADFIAYRALWDARDTAQQARIAELEAQQKPAPPTTLFGVDLSDITGDAPLSEAQKVDAHRALGLALTNVRVFFGSSVPSWSSERIRALDPTRGDSIIVSTLSRDVAGMTAWLKNTPDQWRGHVDLTHGHEREADLLGQANPDAAVADWLAGCQEKADMLDGLGSWGYSSDDFGKIMLHYTQHHGPTTMRDTYERFHGGQDFGWFGEDCYHNAAWLNGSPGRYETPTELFGGIADFCAQAGLPCRIPEWGATLAKGDTDGAGRARAVADGGAYLAARGVLSANWWCATGSKDATQPHGYRDFHLEGTPALAAFLALAG